MLGKILLTSLVIVIAFFVIRQRTLQEHSAVAGSTAGGDNRKPQESSELRFMAYAFLAMILLLAVSMYYFQWRDDHTVLTITLYPDSQGSPIRYEVYKYQLRERSFTTVDGINITVASSERMEIQGLDE